MKMSGGRLIYSEAANLEPSQFPSRELTISGVLPYERNFNHFTATILEGLN